MHGHLHLSALRQQTSERVIILYMKIGLTVINSYPVHGQVKTQKGGVQLAPKEVWITSNKFPHEWWGEGTPYLHEAFYRRLDRIIYMPYRDVKEEYLPPFTEFIHHHDIINLTLNRRDKPLRKSNDNNHA